MSPPRLVRHLRPCQSSWSAHHARCASSTAREKRSTAGDNKPESASAIGEVEVKRPGEIPSPDSLSDSSSNQDASSQQSRSWWRSTVDSVVSLGSRTASSDSGTQPPPVEHSAEQRSPTVLVTPDAAQSETGRSNATANTVASSNSSQAKREDTREFRVERDLVLTEEPKFRTRFVQAKPGKFEPKVEERRPRVREVKTSTKFETWHKPDDDRRGHTSSPAPSFNTAATNKGSAGLGRSDKVGRPPTIAKDSDQEAIKQQLQQLSEQIKALQNALEEKTAAATTSSDTGANAVIPRKGEAAHRLPSEQTKVPPEAHVSQRPERPQQIRVTKQPAPPSATRTYPIRTVQNQRSERPQQIRITKRTVKNAKFSPAHILALGTWRFQISTRELINTAHTLRRLKRTLSKQLLDMVERRLTFIARGALKESDDAVISELRRYIRWSRISCSLTAASLLERCNEQYHRSALELASIANSLENIGSPSMTHSTTMIRRQLATLYEEVKAEGNVKMRHALECRKVHKIVEGESLSGCPQPANSQASAKETRVPTPFTHNDKQGLARRIHTRSSLLNSSESLQRVAKPSDLEHKDGSTTASGSNDAISLNKTQAPTEKIKAPVDKVQATSNEVSDQSLLEELFPEASVAPPAGQAEKQEHYPKLDPPKPTNRITRMLVDRPKSPKELMIESLQKRGEQVTVLQLEHCSTELTEIDFRRLIPKGEHMEVLSRLGAYYKVIPGRDPLSLERLPFYFLLFKSPESAYAYQRNASRLHKLAALHQPSSIFSAIPAPKGFLEDGEDVNAVTTSYLLRPTEHAFTLRAIMQPYDSALRTLIEQGGYKPIVPEIDGKRNRIYKVLMYIEGYEPSISDLFKTLRQDAFNRGMPFTLRNESCSSVHRLRDLIDLSVHTLSISSSNPWAHEAQNTRLQFQDPAIASLLKSGIPEDASNAKEVNQMIMNRVYNRWILEFDDEDEARRFAISWHRRLLPDFAGTERTWKDYEEVRMCNTELLW
ncbi:hypothetical protein HBI38_030220 [Parastagonospora nodorum]|nr:hypothetical protein HBH74_224530 [Parastagonospora nodorum]KAH4972864.1 hypothetical protein HBI78_013480 [Parastagonospora nodorum]KAH4991070.1 hypothetical protein HBH73_017850 [Parastagonospora nodorum]KAH5095545.1 hypothetical protein HBH72_148560 [Parastagonospora nodorum]KAH5166184.1 hypothetical protein HBI73_025510 [Parastagonospora nodorum]